MILSNHVMLGLVVITWFAFLIRATSSFQCNSCSMDFPGSFNVFYVKVYTTLLSLESLHLQIMTTQLPRNDTPPRIQIDTRSTKFDMRSLQDENSSGSGEHFSTDCAKQQNLNSSVILQYREMLYSKKFWNFYRPWSWEIILSCTKETGSPAKATSPSLQMNVCTKNFSL